MQHTNVYTQHRKGVPMKTKQYSKLRGRIVEKYGSIAKFADHLEMGRPTLSCKLNNRRGISRKDIVTFCEALDIDKAEIGDYFF